MTQSRLYFAHASVLAVALTAMSSAQMPDAIHYTFDAGDATNSAVPAAGLAVGLPGAAVVFGSAGICSDLGDPGVLSTGAGADSRIDTGWATDLGMGDWSIGCWMDNTVGVGNTNFFQYIFGDSSAGSFRSFCEGAAGNGNILLRGPFTQVIIAGGVSDTAPTHVCWVYDSGAAEIRGYLNGVLNVTVAQASAFDITGTGANGFAVVGYNGSTSAMRAGTAMDEFRVYRSAIDQATIDEWVSCRSQILKYDFDLGDATNSAVPGGGLAIGLPGTGVNFGSGGICEGAGDPAALSAGAGADSRIDTGWATDLGTSSFTIGCWMDNTIGAGNTNFFQYIFGDSSAGGFRSFCEGAAGNGNILLRGPFTEVVIAGGVSDTEPTHVCWIYDAPALEIRGYLNGVLNVTVAQATPLDINASGTGIPFSVLGYNGSTSSMRDGTAMDDFRLYRGVIGSAALAKWSGCADVTLGTSYCTTVANSTGVSGVITATGSTYVSNGSLTLSASSLPQASFAVFLASTTPGQIMNPGGSAGNICLDGEVGRGVGGAILNTGNSGSISIAADLAAMPQPMGAVAVLPGDTWYFQCWHRDLAGGMTTSNFTDAVGVTFQ